LGAFGQWVLDTAPLARDFVVDCWYEAGQVCGHAFAWLAKHLGLILDKLGPALRSTFKNMWKSIIWPFVALWEMCRATFMSVLEFLHGLMVALADKAYEAYVVTPGWVFLVVVVLVVAIVHWRVTRWWNKAPVAAAPATEGEDVGRVGRPRTRAARDLDNPH
jgi:hypothetical protein